MRERLANGEIVIATDGDRLLGCIRLYEVEPGVAQFGVLAVDPEQQGAGVGNALIDFVERRARERGATRMRLELLVPLTGSHPGKDRLDRWYTRRGYRPVGRRSFDDPELATPCEFVIYERPLSSPPHL
jgi:GNAT superfamily N-acetyltransferase